VKYLKILILLCGLGGLAGLIVPVHDVSLIEVLFEIDTLQGVLYTAMFALPVVVAVIALIKRPMRPWQAGVALACFALAAMKLSLWNIVRHLGSAEPYQLGMTAAVVIGGAAAIALLLRPEVA
jgi:hypothetical protein